MAQVRLMEVTYQGRQRVYSFEIDGERYDVGEKTIASLQQQGWDVADQLRPIVDEFKKELPGELRKVHELAGTVKREEREGDLTLCVGMHSDHFTPMPLKGTVRVSPEKGVAVKDRDLDGKVDEIAFRTQRGVAVTIKAKETFYHFRTPCTHLDRAGVESFLAAFDGLTCIGCNLD